MAMGQVLPARRSRTSLRGPNTAVEAVASRREEWVPRFAARNSRRSMAQAAEKCLERKRNGSQLVLSRLDWHRDTWWWTLAHQRTTSGEFSSLTSTIGSLDRSGG